MPLSLQSTTPLYGANYSRGYIGFVAEDTSDFVSQGIAYLTRREDRSGIAVTHVLVVTGENECVEALAHGVVRSPLAPYFDSPRPIFLKAPVGCAVGEASVSGVRGQGSGGGGNTSSSTLSSTLSSLVGPTGPTGLTCSAASFDKVEDKVKDKVADIVAENALKMLGLPYGYGLIVTDCLANTLAGHFLNKCLAGWPNRLISKLADWNDLAPVCSVVAACALNPPHNLRYRLGLKPALGPIGCLARNPARTITPQMLFEDTEIFP
ncbi:MAG: hypothetical protein C5B50_07865 [Verrucomicrobia bacterium]|nr:MAG: hypothetical protein C5B50_07865 [Verrucomicrobiota bacterium]